MHVTLLGINLTGNTCKITIKDIYKYWNNIFFEQVNNQKATINLVQTYYHYPIIEQFQLYYTHD